MIDIKIFMAKKYPYTIFFHGLSAILLSLQSEESWHCWHLMVAPLKNILLTDFNLTLQIMFKKQMNNIPNNG